MKYVLLILVVITSTVCRATDIGEFSTAGIIMNASVGSNERLKAVHSLGRELKEFEINALCQFIKALPEKREKNLPALQLIKNDLVNALMEQTVPPVELTGTLIEAYQNERQDLVTRDYALQHLVTWYEQGAAGSSSAREKIRSTLQKATREQNSIAGTALLGMHRLAACDAAFNRQEIKQMSLALAGHAPTLATRITAIQVCAEEGVVEALPSIRSIIGTETSIPLRISAIAALGQLGGEQDIPLLQKLEAGSHPVLRPAIEAALRRLQHEFQIPKVALNLN